MNELGAVVVTWNSQELIGPCLEALRPWVGEVVVVDNASEDGTVEEGHRRAGVRWIVNPNNRGFAGAANQGIAALEKPFVLLLNPDVVLLDSPAPLLEACQAPKVGAAAGQLVGADLRPQLGFAIRRFPGPLALALEVLGVNRLWPGNPVNRRYRCRDLDWSQPSDVEQPAGAFLLIRKAAWQAVGGFDEAFHPVWFEDVDFLKRLREGGWRVRYAPACRARHAGGGSVRKISREDRELCWYSNLLRYAAKHLSPEAFSAVCLSVMTGAALRLVTGIARERSLRPARIFRRVAAMACRALADRRPSDVTLPLARWQRQAEQQKVRAPVS
ncbi:MAG: glycosyltransferase family 2 protein [Bryobacterales bacterium]|nr:glycosyltransferase family 2 protein [Bryobacteraceae bacterium]MDW8353150.1 glycosyltransferase family 2 protein [Bryobacterales bacterium]